MRLFILLVLVFVILVSGCVEQGPISTGSTNDGVVIKQFSFDSSIVNEGDRIGLNLEIQNVGGVKATVKSATLFGPDLSTWSVTGPTPNIAVDLSPSVPEANFEGEARSTRWRVNAPDVNSETNYNFGARIVYSYSTVYTGTLRLVQESYLETLPEGERSSLLESSGVFSSSVTGGPLTVKPMEGRNFIVSGSGGTSTLVFELSNTGSGYPANGATIDKDTMYNVEISSWNGLTNCNSYGSRTLRLSKGKNRLFTCNFTIPSSIVNKQDIVFSITFNYHYYVDGIASITVNPLYGAASTGGGSTTTTSSGGTSTAYTTTTVNYCADVVGTCKTETDCRSIANYRCYCKDCLDCVSPINCCCVNWIQA
jgi:hypothetical protein